MKSEKFFEVFTELDDDLIENAVPKIEEAETVQPASRSFSWKTIALSAAAVITVFAAVFVGVKLIGSHRLNINEPPAITSENSNSSPETSVQFGSIEVDWQVYSSAEQLIEHGDIIVSGKVTDISFAMLDKCTGKVVDANSKGSESELCTIYDIDVITPYKGCDEETLQIRMEGGLENYMVDEQIKVLKEHGGDRIAYLSDPPKIELGEEYLFLLAQFEDTLPCIINSFQTAFPLKDRTTNEKYSNASVDDIILQFCKISVVHKGEPLTITAEQSEDLYFLMKEAWDKVQVANEAIISEGQMREYSETGYLITANHNLYVLIGEDENDTVIGNYSQTGLPEGYYERFMKILDSITEQQTAQNKVSAVYKGRTLTLTTEQVDALYSLMYEAESKVGMWDFAEISEQDKKDYGEKGYCISSNNGLVVLIGENESDTLIGNSGQAGLPEGYYEKFMKILNGNTLQQDPQNKVAVVHEGETLLLTAEQSEALLEAVEQALFNDCGPLSELNRIISTQDMEEYGNNGYCITTEFSDYDVPQIEPESDQRVNKVVDMVVLIGEEGKSSYITYGYIVYSADGVSEKLYGGTFPLSRDSRESILKVLNGESEGDTSLDKEPNTFFTTKSVTFEQAKEQVNFADVKEIFNSDFIGYELGYVMPSGTVGKMTYLFKSGKVTVYDNSVIEVDFSTELNEKYERDGKVFWKTLEDAEDIRVLYKADTGTVYLAEMDPDIEEAIDVILSLI